MAKTYDTTTPEFSKIISGTNIKGDVKTQGDIRIDGSLNGTLDCMGKLVVGPQGVIEGEVKCKNADISGLLKVNIQVDGILNLKATAKLMGDIKVKKIAIEPGAVFSGKCEMTGGVSTNDEQKEVIKQGESEKK
jgi:cytoskeletal protein CcmA (bactofilin family)